MNESKIKIMRMWKANQENQIQNQIYPQNRSGKMCVNNNIKIWIALIRTLFR